MAVTTWKAQNHLEVLCLGDIEVGRVSATGGRKNRPRWIFNLAYPASFWRDALTIEQARAELLAALDGWLQRAGLA